MLEGALERDLVLIPGMMAAMMAPEMRFLLDVASGYAWKARWL
jgi:hypothetical protein